MTKPRMVPFTLPTNMKSYAADSAHARARFMRSTRRPGVAAGTIRSAHSAMLPSVTSARSGS